MTRRRPNGYFGSRVGSLLSSYRQLLSNLSLAVAQDVAVMWVGIPQMEEWKLLLKYRATGQDVAQEMEGK